MVMPSTARAVEENILGERRGIFGKRLAIAIATIAPKSHGKGTLINEKSMAPRTPINSDATTGKKPLSHCIERPLNDLEKSCISHGNDTFFFIKNN